MPMTIWPGMDHTWRVGSRYECDRAANARSARSSRTVDTELWADMNLSATG
jgi:hypothetical protein